MDNPTVIAAIVGFVSAVVGSIIAGVINHRRLSAELRAQRRKEYFGRQLAACEALWKQLLPLTEHACDASLVQETGTGGLAYPKRANRFCEDITAEFYAPTGLYLSRDVREKLFRLRGFLHNSLVKRHPDCESVEVGKRFFKTYAALKQQLIRAIRMEVGVLDLQVGRETFEEIPVHAATRDTAPRRATPTPQRATPKTTASD
jgi:hypothetical protein